MTEALFQKNLYYSSIPVKWLDETLASGFDSINRRSGVQTSLIPDGLHAIPEGTECWHTLCPPMVTAQGFPVKQRSQGRGLEISFADMAKVAGCLSLATFDDGLVANGLN